MRLFRRNKIGRASIKESLDNLPCGICFADKNGMIVLCNKQMHRLCHILLGMELQHLSELRRVLNNTHRQIEYHHNMEAAAVCRINDKQVWHFSETEITDAEGNSYTQIQAIDVTAVYEKEIELNNENKALEEAISRAGKIYAELDEIVRDEQNFAVKTRVHDELSELLGLTRNILLQEEETLDKIQSIGQRWEQLSHTLGLVDYESEDKKYLSPYRAFAELKEMTEGIGVKLTLSGNLPQNSKLAYILITAIRECATNTVRHAEGSEVTVEITQENGTVRAAVTNNGKPPEGNIFEGGGLSALRRRIESIRGTMRVESVPMFRLVIIMPSEGAAI